MLKNIALFAVGFITASLLWSAGVNIYLLTAREGVHFPPVVLDEGK